MKKTRLERLDQWTNENPRIFKIIGNIVVLVVVFGGWRVLEWQSAVREELKSTPLFVEDAHRISTKILNAPSGPTGELRFVVDLIEADVSGTFWLVNRGTRVKQKFTVAVGEKARSLTVPVGEYALYPDDDYWATPKSFKCITHEGAQAYETRCMWKGSVPEIFQVKEDRLTVVQPQLWIATAQQPKRIRSDRRLCGIDPVNFRDYGECKFSTGTCVREASGYSFCADGDVVYRKPISTK